MHLFKDSKARGDAFTPLLDKHLFDTHGPYRHATMDEEYKGYDRITESGLKVEYKVDVVAGRTGNAFLEIVSNDTTMRKGWVHTSQCDELWYYIPPIGDMLVLTMAALRSNLGEWTSKYKIGAARNPTYSSLGVCVPVDVVRVLAEEVVKIGDGG